MSASSLFEKTTLTRTDAGIPAGNVRILPTLKTSSRAGTTMDVSKWTYTRLFDHLQETLGIGDFSGEPWEYQSWRMQQIGMIKRVMQRRNVSMAEMVMCAEYCKAHHIQPEMHAGLLRYYDAARKWSKSRRVEEVQAGLDEAVALEQERVFSDEEASRWVDMLLRATGPNRGEVLERWKKERSRL